MSIKNFTDQQALMPMMGRLMKEFKGLVNNELTSKGVKLSKEQLIVLKILSDKDGRPQQDLAIVTCRDKTSLSRLLATMESKKLIHRKQSSEDKRINLVYLTKQGKKEFDRAKPIALKIVNKAIKGIDKIRIEQTKTLLKEIYENLNINHEE